MKTIILIIVLGLTLPFYAHAQEKDAELNLLPTTEEATIKQSVTKDSLSAPLNLSISYPSYTQFGMYGISPFDYGFNTWELHKGFNASIGLNLTFSPSRFAPSGVGFGQDATFLYAAPINKRFSIAGGLYASHMDWGFLSYKNVGITGIAAFKVNEKISIYAYGNKSLMPQRSPYYYPIPYFNPDKIGGMVNFKLGESASISVGIEGRKYNY